MIDQTTPTPHERHSLLQLPPQAAPIDRSQSPASAVSSDGGVEAAFGWSDLLDIGKVALPTILSAVSDRTLKRDITLVEWSH